MRANSREWGELVSRLFGWRTPAVGSPWRERILQLAQNQGVDLGTLCRQAGDGDASATARLAELGAVDETYFLRDPEPLEAALRRCRAGPPLRLWSAGCASGEEAYTLALLAHAMYPGRGCSVLGTDIVPGRLEEARHGVYSRWSFRGPHADRARALMHAEGPYFAVSTRVRACLRFMQHNLVDPPPPGEGPFDLIVCRNVLLYFLPEVVTRVLSMLAAALRPGGLLVTSPMEVIGPRVALRAEPGCPLGVFRRMDDAAAKAAPQTARQQAPTRILPAPPRAPAPPAEARPPESRGSAEASAAIERGMACLDAGELSEALASFQAALRLEDRMPLAWLGQAFARLQLGESPAARDAARRVIDLTEGEREWQPVPGGGDKMSVGQARTLAAQILEMGG